MGKGLKLRVFKKKDPTNAIIEDCQLYGLYPQLVCDINIQNFAPQLAVHRNQNALHRWPQPQTWWVEWYQTTDTINHSCHRFSLCNRVTGFIVVRNRVLVRRIWVKISYHTTSPHTSKLPMGDLYSLYTIIFFSLFSLCTTQTRPKWSTTPLNPPSLPLAVKSPYLNTWLAQGNNPPSTGADWPTLWTNDNVCFGTIKNPT
jgi:hypothetical protein